MKINVPNRLCINNISYIEMDSAQEKIAWIFFKHIKLKSCYSITDLEKAAEQVGNYM